MKDFELGDRVVADVGISVRCVLVCVWKVVSSTRLQCDNCFYCRRGQAVLCENFNARGVTMDGGFAEYIV